MINHHHHHPLWTLQLETAMGRPSSCKNATSSHYEGLLTSARSRSSKHDKIEQKKKFIIFFHTSLKTELQQCHVQSDANCCSKIIKRKVLDNSDHRTTFKKALHPCVSSFQCLKKMFFLNCSSAQCVCLQVVLGISEENYFKQ